MIRRAHVAGVLGVEVWDVHVPLPDGGERPLYEFMTDDERVLALPHAIGALRSGRATAWSGRAFPVECRAIEGVVLTGGNASVKMARAIEGSGLPCLILDETTYAGTLGARVVAMEELGISEGVAACDVGQTSIKVAFGSTRFRVERDRSLIPFVDDLDRQGVATARAHFIEWLGGALARIEPRPAALVLALPCDLDDDGALGGCTYPWERGERTIVAEVIARAGLEAIPVLLHNDAELAGAAATTDARVTRDRTWLVLTIGMGIGGALVSPRRHA